MDIVPSTEKTLKVEMFFEDFNNIEDLNKNVNAFIYREKIHPEDVIDLKMSTLAQCVTASPEAYRKLEGKMYVICTLLYVS